MVDDDSDFVCWWDCRCEFTVLGVTEFIHKFPGLECYADCEVKKCKDGIHSVWRCAVEGKPEVALQELVDKLKPQREAIKTCIVEHELYARFEIVLFSHAIDFGEVIEPQLLAEVAAFGAKLQFQAYMCSDDEEE